MLLLNQDVANLKSQVHTAGTKTDFRGRKRSARTVYKQEPSSQTPHKRIKIEKIEVN